MADVSSFEPPSSGDSGVPPWLLVGGAIAGVLGLILLLTRNSGGTTAAGSSINAALGSLQEQQLQLAGQQSKDALDAQRRTLYSLWAQNQVAYAAAEQSALTSNPNLPNAQQIQSDIDARLKDALGVWTNLLGGAWPASSPQLAADNAASHQMTATTGSF